MKYYFDKENGNTLIVGSSSEIRAMYKALRRAWWSDRFSIGPSHLDFPILVNGNVYGIEIVPDERRFWIRNASSVLELLELV